MSARPTWIWSFGDFELYHHRKLSLSREERGHIVPAFWQLYGPNCLVKFRKSVELEQDETIQIRADGDAMVQLGWKRISCDRPVTLPAGKHDLVVVVGNETGIPAIFVEGATIHSDASWEATAFDGTWGQVGCWNLDDPAVRPTVYSLPTVPIEAAAQTATERGTLYDFGKEVAVKLALSGLIAGQEYHVCYGESIEEAMDSEHAVLSESFVANGPERTLRTRACRYARVEGAGAVARGLYEYLPLESRATFRSSDELLNAIFEISDYTLRQCSRLFYLDGIKRDGWVWGGDAYQSFFLNYYSHFDVAIIQRTLLALRGGDPIVSHVNTIVDYSLYWLISLADYYQYTGDAAFIRRVYERAVSLIEFCILRQDANGLLVGLQGDWTFIDWADMDKSGALCAMQMLYCKALEAMAACSALVGQPEKQARYAGLGQAVREKIDGLYWSEALGAYVTNALDGKPTEEVRRHANIFALMFGFAGAAQRERILANVILNDAVPQITTPYFKFYELDALCQAGRLDKVSEVLRSYWGGMLNEGATTFWEEYDPRMTGTKHLEMYHEPFDKSLCHAWGASPLYLLGKYYLGVTPTQPGYAEFEVCPRLGGLERIEGQVPLPGGGMVRVKADGHMVEIETSASGGTYVGGGQRVALAPGQVNRFQVDLR